MKWEDLTVELKQGLADIAAGYSTETPEVFITLRNWSMVRSIKGKSGAVKEELTDFGKEILAERSEVEKFLDIINLGLAAGEASDSAYQTVLNCKPGYIDEDIIAAQKALKELRKLLSELLT